MEIRKIRLSNVGRFTDLDVAFAPTEKHPSKVTVFVGNNGAGKTTILKSIATSFSWLVARIRSERANGSPIAHDDIANGAPSASVTIDISSINHPAVHLSTVYSWTLARTLRARKSKVESELTNVTLLADFFRFHLGLVDESSSLPLIVFYPVERSVKDVPLKVGKAEKEFEQFDGYDNALNGGVDFGRFFQWFREREDSENERGISFEALKHWAAALPDSETKLIAELRDMHIASRDVQLTAVRLAIEVFMPGFNNLRVQRKPRLHMAIDKAGKTLIVSQLSQGEKSLLALVGDIARRLAIMNPSLENPLHGNGIVLIDEVDLHLHPQWQRRLIRQLTQTFPNCQFILTTHSPLVISDTKDVLCYVLDDGELEERNGLYGLDANQVLLSVMDTDVRNSEVQERLDLLLELLQDRKLKEAKALFNELSADLPPGHIELTKASLLIRKLELRSA